MNIEYSRIEVISSANRNSGTNENFTYVLDNVGHDEEYDYVCVLFANIPISYYLVVSNYNTFVLKQGITQYTITVPIGNYSANSFIAVILPLMNAVSSWVYTMTINNSFTNVSNGLFNWSVTGNAGVQPSFIFGSLEGINDQMGFSINSTNTFVGSSLSSINVVNFVPETTFYIYSDLIETKQNNTTNILQEIYGQNGTNFSNLVYQCTSLQGYSRKINKKKTNSFSITLVSEDGNIISLNGRPFFITLLFYKKDNLFSIIKKYIKHLLTS